MKVGDKVVSLCETSLYKKGTKAVVVQVGYIECDEYLAVKIKNRAMNIQVLADHWKKVEE